MVRTGSDCSEIAVRDNELAARKIVSQYAGAPDPVWPMVSICWGRASECRTGCRGESLGVRGNAAQNIVLSLSVKQSQRGTGSWEMVVGDKLPHCAGDTNQFVITCLLSGAADWFLEERWRNPSVE